MNIRQATFALRRSIATRGLLRSITHLTRRAISLRHSNPNADRRHPFDVEYDLDTSGLISGHELASGHAHDLQNTAYYGIAPSVFREILERWAGTTSSISRSLKEYTFVDLGAGKGRAVLLASEQPFLEAIGVELNRGLAEIADQNGTKWKELGRARCALRIVNQDATEFSWPPSPLLVYLFNPFGQQVLKEVLARLETCSNHSRQPIDILYVNPEFGSVLDRHPNLRKLWSERIGMNESDKAMDAFEGKGEVCSAYRLRPREA